MAEVVIKAAAVCASLRVARVNLSPRQEASLPHTCLRWHRGRLDRPIPRPVVVELAELLLRGLAPARRLDELPRIPQLVQQISSLMSLTTVIFF